MFSLINLLLTIIVLIRLYKYDKFYLLTYDMKVISEEDKRNRYRGNKSTK